MKKIIIIFLACLIYACHADAADMLIEAESFSVKGGWKIDQQFMDVMGSPYLIAHGMGIPVADATQNVVFAQTGKYCVYVRTYNWTSPWHKGKGPGQFTVCINGKQLPVVAGCEGERWIWQYIGDVNITKSHAKVSLHDMTGFDGRCDALYFSTGHEAPPSDVKALEAFRQAKCLPAIQPASKVRFDFVVVGGGIAGICAAVAAARQGIKIALINDRPVLGGNNSSEIRVHLGGAIGVEPYPNLGNLLKEFGPTREGNARHADYYEDSRKMDIVKGEKNITLFLNTHIIAAKTEGERIKEIIGRNIVSNQETIFEAPLYSDCTGDGSVGALAGADFMIGREDKAAFREARAEDKADKMTMGASVQWYAEDTKSPTTFPLFEYGVNFNENSKKAATRGDWDWETGMNYDQITDAEYIRDYGLMVVYSNWSFLKNRSIIKDNYANKQLDWVAYIAGKRESRRLVGDYILNGNDILNQIKYPDATACTTWSIDLHSPNKQNSIYFPGHEFISTAIHTKIHPYPVPYRCLYSHNISNLFMAGRDVSVTHVALGTVRVMRTGAMLGEVVGLAASLCHKHDTTPRAIYTSHLPELIQLMQVGAGKQGLKNNQLYNGGRIRKE